MATITFSDLGRERGPSLSELMGQLDFTLKSSTLAVFAHNEEFNVLDPSYGFGFTFEVIGEDFAQTASGPVGTITGIRILDESGNLYATIAPGADGYFNDSLRNFHDYALAGDFFAFTALLNDDDLMLGTAGNDVLHVVGVVNFDTLNGGAGDDLLLSGGGQSTQAAHLDGGAGIDRAVIDRSHLTVGLKLNLANVATLQSLGDGTKIVRVESIEFEGGTGNDTIAGGGHDDQILGGGGSDRFAGNGGNDTLRAEGNSTVFGGAGDDDITSDDSDDLTAVSIDGGGGLDTVDLNRSDATVNFVLSVANPGVLQVAADGTRFVNCEQIQFSGGSGNDRITGGALEDDFNGREGDNVFIAGAGDDDASTDGSGRNTMDGGAGSDHIDYLSAVTAAVNVTLKGVANATVFIGGVATDIIRNVEQVSGGSGNDTLIGDGFDNRFTGGGGQNAMRGGAGNDTISSGNAGDTVDGGAGTADLLLIQRVSQTVGYSIDLSNPNALQVLADGTRITGFEQIDILAGEGDDSIIGGALDDRVFAGRDFADTTRNDSFDGRGGFDLVDYSELLSENDITIVLRGAQSATVLMDGKAAGTLRNVEAVHTNGGDDRLTGDGAANEFETFWGNDSLSGGAGNDTIIAGGAVGPPDRDTIQGGAGQDSIDGGIGLDTAIYAEKAKSVQVTLSGFVPAVVTVDGIAEDTIVDIENITGGSAADRIIGDGRSNVFVGGGGNDRLDGGDANDRLSGDSGNDSLTGGAAADTLSGGAGDDTVAGGLGIDNLSGGTGRDRFDFTVPSWGGDRIADYEDGLDKLMFKRSIADDISDFTIIGNGTETVTLRIGAQSLQLRGDDPITLTNADFQFLA